MTAPLLAYRCTGPDAFEAGLPVGCTVQRKRGFHIALTLCGALAERAGSTFGEGWPFRVFEVAVAPSDLLDPEAYRDGVRGVRARAFRVSREVPLTEALGPRAVELIEHVESVPRISWLRPRGALPGSTGCSTGSEEEAQRSP